MVDADELEARVRSCLASSSPPAQRLAEAVAAIARAFEARTCTLHRLDPPGASGAADASPPAPRMLRLLAEVGLPPHIREITREIPLGKGMAGVCAERREPVTVCNLQSDDSGIARPAARDTRVAGALVVPALRGDEVIATLGVGKDGDHDYSEEEIALLTRCAEEISRAW